MADYTLLDLIPSFSHREHGSGWGDVLGNAKPLLNPDGTIGMTHVVLAVFALVVIVVLALIARGKYSSKDRRRSV